MHQEDRIASLSVRVLILYLACNVTVGEDIRRFVIALLRGQCGVFGWIVYMPQRKDEAILRLHVEFFDIQADTPCVVCHIADEWIWPTLQGLVFPSRAIFLLCV